MNLIVVIAVSGSKREIQNDWEWLEQNLVSTLGTHATEWDAVRLVY